MLEVWTMMAIRGVVVMARPAAVASSLLVLHVVTTPARKWVRGSGYLVFMQKLLLERVLHERTRMSCQGGCGMHASGRGCCQGGGRMGMHHLSATADPPAPTDL